MGLLRVFQFSPHHKNIDWVVFGQKVSKHVEILESNNYYFLQHLGQRWFLSFILTMTSEPFCRQEMKNWKKKMKLKRRERKHLKLLEQNGEEA